MQWRDGSELTPYQLTASPAARVQPAAATESDSDSDWWVRQLPDAACRRDDSAVLRRGAQLAVDGQPCRCCACHRGAGLALADAGQDNIAMSDADTEPLDDSDAEPEAEAADSHRDDAGGCAT